MENSEKRSRKVQYLATFAVSLVSFCLGATAAWPSPVLLKFKNSEVSFRITDTEISWMITMSPVGFLIGSVVSRYVADNFGRRITILVSSVPMVLGCLTALFAQQACVLYVARILWGLGSGIAGMVISMYVAEISDKEIRGTLTTFPRVVGNLGSLVVMAIGTYVSYAILNCFLLLTAIAYFLACWWIPESPYYYMKGGRTNDARRVIALLRNEKDLEKLDNAVVTIQAYVKEDMTRASSVRELFTGRMYRKPLIVAAVLKITQIMSGITTIQHYLGLIMQESGSTLNVSTALIIFGAVNFGVGLISSALVDRMGRRPLFISTSFGLGVSLLVVGAYFFLQEVMHVDHKILHPYAIVAFVGIILSLFIASLGVTPLSYVIPAEIFPMNVKAVALSTTNIFASILGFTMAIGYQKIKENSGLYGVFWFYGGIALFGAVFSFLLLPETKGKCLEEIQMELQGRSYYDNVDLCKNSVVDLEMTERRSTKNAKNGDIIVLERL